MYSVILSCLLCSLPFYRQKQLFLFSSGHLEEWGGILLNKCDFSPRDLMKSGIIWKAMKCEKIFLPSMAKKCIKMEGKSTNNEKTSNTSSKYGNAGHI